MPTAITLANQTLVVIPEFLPIEQLGIVAGFLLLCIASIIFFGWMCLGGPSSSSFSGGIVSTAFNIIYLSCCYPWVKKLRDMERDKRRALLEEERAKKKEEK